MKHAYITGILGFVGRHLADLLARQGWPVSGIDLGRAAPRGAAFSYAPVDILDYDALVRHLTAVAPTVIFHLAAVSSVAVSQRSPRETLVTNTDGTVNLLEAIRHQAARPRLVFISSCEVYGQAADDELPVRETVPVRPLSPYAASKACAEDLVGFYARGFGLDALVLRPFTHTGPGQNENFVFPSVARRIAEIERGELTPVLEMGNIDVQRDYMDVRDVVRAYLLAAEHGAADETYNVTGGVPISIRRGIEMMLELSPKPVAVRVDPARFRPSDIRILTGDGAKFSRLTGWKPEIPLTRTFGELLDYYRHRGTAGARPSAPPA